MLSNFKKNQKRSPRKHLLVTGGAALLLMLLLFLTAADINVYLKKKEFDNQISQLKGKIQTLKQQNGELQQEIQNSDNSQYVEKIAREQLDMQQPGEKVVSFIQNNTDQQQDNTANQNNFFQSWMADVSNFFNWMTGKK